MKKYITITIIFVLLSIYMMAQDKYDFRKTKWGMTKQEVMKSEDGAVESNGDLIIFDSISNIPVIVIYQFSNNKLASAGYVFQGKHINNDLFLEDFDKINGILIEKYGKPNKDLKIWSSESKIRNDNLGFSVSVGALSFRTAWFLPRTGIVHSLSGDNGNINHIVTYNSPYIDIDNSIDKGKL